MKIDLNAFIQSKKGKDFVVTDIGSGHGLMLKEIKEKFSENNPKTVSMDLKDFTAPQNKSFIDELILGDVLEAEIPKSDLIFSTVSLSFIGHPDFMVNKIAEALKPGGLAIIGTTNESVTSPFGLKNFSSFLDQLIDGKIKLPNCRIKGKKTIETQYYLAGEEKPVNSYTIAIYKNKK